MLSWLGLRSRLMLLVLMALMPVFGLFACAAAKNQQALVVLAQASLQSEALLAAAHQQRLIERTAQLLGDIASGPSIKNPRNRLCEQYLANLQSQNPGYSNLGVVDLQGNLTCHALDSGDAVYLGDRVFFKEVLAGRQFAVGEYAVSRSSGKPGIAFGVPVYSAGGALNGVAFAGLELSALMQELARGPVLEGARLRVIDRGGTVLSSYPASEGVQGRLEQDAWVLQAGRAAQAGVREAVDASGVERMYAYAPVGGAGAGQLFVAISVPRHVVTGAPRAQLIAEFAALLAVTALGMACAWVMGKRLVVHPTHALLQEANEIARGNFQARVSPDPSPCNEIGRLGMAFNQMAESLQKQCGERDAALRQADEERALLDLIVNSMSEGVIAIDADGRFTLFNAAARTLFSAPAAGEAFEAWRQRNPLVTLDGKAETPDGPLRQTLRGASIDNWELALSRPGVPERILRMSSRPLLGPNNGQVGALTVFIDVTAARANKLFALAQERVLVLIAGGAPLDESLAAIVELVEKISPACLCSILKVQGRQLRYGAAPSLPPELVRATNGMVIAEGPGAGGCGTAAFRGEPVVVADVARDPLMHGYSELLQAHGLRACWSTPVMDADGKVMATFAIYRRTPGTPQTADLALTGVAVRLAGLALERARAEAALLRSDTRFQELAQNIDDVFYSMDARSGSMLYVSPGYEKVWGRSCASLYAAPGSHADAVLSEDRREIARADVLNRAGQMSSVEYRILSTSGQTRWIRDRSYPVFNAAGDCERVVGTARDITESKLAELALAATHRALQMLSRSCIAINRIHDEAGLLAEVCRVAVEVGGYRMAWVGYAGDGEEKSIVPAAHAGHEAGYLDEVRLCWHADRPQGQGPAGWAIRTGLPQQTSDIGQPDNNFHWSDAAMQRGYRSALALPLCSEQHSFGILCLYTGEVKPFAPEEIGLLQELADNLAFGIVSLRARLEHQRGEQAVRQAAALLREQASLIDLAPDAIVVRNLDLTVRFWSKGAEQLYGWPAEAVIGKTLLDVTYRDPRVLLSAVEQIYAADGNWTGEVEQVASDGSSVHVEMRGTLVRDENGQPNGVMTVNTDIRERKQAREEILRLNASLEERVEQRTAQLKFANQQLEAFSYSVSHDLRTPLSSINAFSTLLERSIKGAGAAPLSERSEHYLARIRAGVGQMGELIDAMLLLAQVSRSRLVWEPVDLSAKAEALLLALREHAPGRGVQWQVEPGLRAMGDARLLRQVLDNLLGNAWKFTSQKPSARITVGQCVTGQGETAYFVRDNGAGFEMAYASKLFGAFQRLHTEAEFAGTGIGLATVQRIIERHGGTVWAESVVGEGATFYFTLGAAPA